tara:strand:+ start:382 stop:882 length:501 start_codon:yes stop_codon:yes gene_type:complete
MYEQSIQEGYTAEDEFSRLAKLRGFIVKPATGMEQFDHIDFHLTSDEEDGIMTAMVDVKARKRIKRTDDEFQDEWIWIEFKNVRGKDGWLHGLADFIAFETKESFILSFRKELADWCESHVDQNFKVTSAEEARYCVYTRKGKQDLISLIRLKDIEKLPNTAIWKK